MASRWVSPEGVEVHANDFQFHISAEISRHLRALLDESATGVVSGLVTTINGVNNQRVDLSAGVGYAPNGEFVSLSPGQSSIALASNILGVVNILVAVATETLSNPQPHEANSTSPFTRANSSVRIRMYTAAQFAALPATDANLANDSQDRSLILARITATGGALTAGSIQSPTAFNTINFGTQPVNITGVVITAVSSNTAEGTGTLAFTFAGLTLTWTPPGGSAGAAVPVGAGGAFVLSGGGPNPPTLGVTVISASLPVANQSDAIIVTNLYSQVVPRFTAEDSLHRSLLGTGTPTTTNAHGLRVSDLGGVELVELESHIDLQHSNGIWRGSSAGALAVTVDETTAPDRLLVTAPAGGDTYWVDGRRLTSIISTTTPILFGAAPANAILYEVLVNNVGALSVSARATWPDPRAVTGVEIIDVSDNTPVGARTLAFTFAGTLLRWDGGPQVDVSAGGRFRLISTNDLYTIDVFVISASLPGAPVSDSITVNALASTEAFLRLALVPWAGSLAGTLGFGTLGSKQLLDKRLYGTLSDFEIRDETIFHVVPGAVPNIPINVRRNTTERRTDELRVSGVIFGLERTEANSLAVVSGGGLNVTVAGGLSYIFGKRYERVEQTGFTLPDNSTSFVYLDVSGVLQTSASLALSQIVGDSTLNNPGIGIALAQVTTLAGAITQIVDYRRNIARLDNIVGSLTVSSFSTRHRAEFFSLRAAKAYADLLGINEIHVTGSVTEVLSAPITIATAFRIVIEPDVGIIASGTAASVFSIAAGGALEILGGGGPTGIGTVFTSSITLISYSGGSESHILLRDLALSLTGSANLIRTLTTAVGNRGIKIENCHIDSTVVGDDLIVFTDSFDGPVQVSDSFVATNAVFHVFGEAFGAAETVNKITVKGCELTGGGIIGFADDNASLTDCWILNNHCDFGLTVVNVRGTARRLWIQGNQIDSDLGVFTSAPSVARTHVDVQILDNVIDNAVTANVVSGNGNVVVNRFVVSRNHFNSIQTTGRTVLLGGATSSQNISIENNRVVAGSFSLSIAVAVTINDNVFDGTSTGLSEGIDFNDIDRFTISDNIMDYRVRGIDVDAASADGIISGNQLRTTVSGGTHGLNNVAPRVSISNNVIRIDGATAGARLGIENVGVGSVITGNDVRHTGTDGGDRCILNSGDSSSISGNRLEFTGASIGTCLRNEGDNLCISGNTVVVTGASGLGIDNNGAGVTVSSNTVVSAATAVGAPCLSNSGIDVAISGNKLEHTAAAAAGDRVSNTGSNTTIIGNTLRSAGSGVGGGGRGIFNSAGEVTIGSNIIIQDLASDPAAHGVHNSGNRASINGNTIQFTSASAQGKGIHNVSDRSTIVGNTIESAGTNTNIDGINNVAGDNVVISSNYIHFSAAVVAGVSAIANTGDSVSINGNSIEYESSTAAGDCISNSGTGCISNNVLELHAGSTVRSLFDTGLRVVVSGNHFSHTAFGTAPSANNADAESNDGGAFINSIYVGNLIYSTAGTVGHGYAPFSTAAAKTSNDPVPG
jgi:hypothetical protein